MWQYFLAVLKRKKLTALYISFKELYQHLHVEQAWMPGMVCQKELSDKLKGGLSAAVKILVKSIHQNARLPIFLGDEAFSFFTQKSKPPAERSRRTTGNLHEQGISRAEAMLILRQRVQKRIRCRNQVHSLKLTALIGKSSSQSKTSIGSMQWKG